MTDHDRGKPGKPNDESKPDDKRREPGFTSTGDGTSWDSGRNSSIAQGSRVEKDLREADAESPGVAGPKPGREKNEDER